MAADVADGKGTNSATSMTRAGLFEDTCRRPTLTSVGHETDFAGSPLTPDEISHALHRRGDVRIERANDRLLALLHAASKQHFIRRAGE